MDLGIDGHVAVVTGAGQGLGAAISAALAEAGCTVAVWDIKREEAETVSRAITDAGGRARAVVADVTDPAQVSRAADQIRRDLGTTRILVNCAGFSRDAPITEMTDEQWDQVIGVCLTGPFYVTRALVPDMIDAGYGRIVNISSRARLGDFNKSNYSSAKAGLVGLTNALAIELGPHGITVNAIAPGFVETERTKGLRYAEDLKRRALERTLTPRLGEPRDIADAVCYLASAQSGFITGEVLALSGGRLR
jgi:3-oxoacyl-[acyl-carrier protein] reductase